MELREWTVLYVKHKDVLARKLQGYKEQGNKLVFTFKDHEMHAYAMEELDVPPELTGKTLIATTQKRRNIDFLVKHWNDFCKHPHLTIVFANPNTNEKWFIIPHTHAQIADPNIETGILALAENVPHVE